jgi:hypothetical protein
MQDEMVAQLTNYESLIACCYPGSGLRLEFSMNECLAMFSEVAMNK